MSQLKRHPLKDHEISLLKKSASELIPEMKADASLKEVRQMAFQHWDTERNEEVQVHVVVTRDPSEFLEPFVTLETT